jgi:hypothetical protein
VKLLAHACALLEGRKIPHALIGAAAMAVRGVSRATVDLDLLATDRRCLDEETWRDLRAEAVSVEIRQGDADDPLAGVVRLERGDNRPLDVVVGRGAWQDEVLEHATPQTVGGVSVPVVTAADLVLLKLYAGGTQDRWDIQQLLAGPDRAQLVAVLDREIAKLPPRCRELWKDLAPR